MVLTILKRPLPYVALVTAHLIWGVNFVVAKLTLEEFPVMSLGFLRFAIATLLITPFLIVEKKKRAIPYKDLPHLFILGVMMVTLNITLFYEGISRTTAINASVLTLIIPLLSVLLGWWLLKEKVYLINLLGILTGLVGAFFIIGAPSISLEGASSQVLLGNFLIILASVAWVLGSILSKPMLKKYTTLDITAVIFFVGLVTFLIPSVNEYLQNPSWVLKVSYLGVIGLLFIALSSSICAYFLFEWGINKLGVIKANLFQYIEPMVATILGILVLNEKVGLLFLIGALLIGLGVYWGTLAKEEHHRRHRAHRH